MRPALRCLVAFALLGAATAEAGIYSTDEAFLFQLDGRGIATALPPNDFRLLLVDWNSLLFAGESKRRQKYTDKAEELSKFTRERPPAGDELTDISYALIRLRKLEPATELLQTAARSRDRDSFFVQAHLAFSQYESGSYREAFEHQFAALRDHPAPKKFGKLTPEQLAWQRKVEKDYLLPLFRMRRESKAKGAAEEPDALFPPRDSRSQEKPLRWLAPAKDYQRAPLSAEDAARLPPDAVAIVQQLLFWNPGDSRLYWLLGELYNWKGEREAALKVFEECVDVPRNYSSPLLMEHRQYLKEFVAEQAKERQAEEDARQEAERSLKRKIAYGGGAVVILFFTFFIRNLVRRIRR